MWHYNEEEGASTSGLAEVGYAASKLAVLCCRGRGRWQAPLMKGGRLRRTNSGCCVTGSVGSGGVFANRAMCLIAVGVLVVGLQYGAVWAARAASAGGGTLYDAGDVRQ